MDSAPLVSILLAVRDGARFLPPALRSVEAQTYRPIELVAVDDGSTDETGAILRAFAEGRPWVRLLRTGGVGPSGARAAAFAAARGALVAIHDADDESRPDRLELQVAFLRAHPEIGVLGSAAEVIDERGDAIAPYRVPLADRDARRLLRRAPPFVHGSVLLRREAYEAAGGFRPVFRCAEDYDLWLRVPPRFGFANLPEPLYRWRLHGEGTFTRTRDLHLRYLAAARAFADERGVRGDDSAGALAAASSWDAFLAGYAGADRVALHWGEALVREGRTAEARQRLAPALRSSRSLLPAAGWWLLSWPVELLPRARRARAAAREAARPQAPTETSA